jgi:hypothetical protein
MLELDRLRATALQADPFDHLYIPAMIGSDDLPQIVRDFPEVPAGGSFDAATFETGPAFQGLLTELRSDAFRALVEEKFDIALHDLPLHITVRGQVRGRDGGIHTDSREKTLTGLVYLNPEWSEPGGRLRLLRNGRDIEDYALEVPPVGGNMLIFRRSDRSWHGHLPSKGRRLSLQFNWVTDERYVQRELARHRVSGWLKRLSGRPAYS